MTSKKIITSLVSIEMGLFSQMSPLLDSVGPPVVKKYGENRSRFKDKNIFETEI